MLDLTPYQVDFSVWLKRDQQGNALAWSLDQFRDKPIYQQVLAAFVSEANELYMAVVKLAQARTIAGASGVWLDGIGRIVGQGREAMPVNMADNFFYWDDADDGTGHSLAVPTDTTPHFMDDHMEYVTGGEVSSGVASDNDFQDEIIRRVFQNMNRDSSAADIVAMIQATLGIKAQVWRPPGVNQVAIRVPVGTPDWMVYFISGRSGVVGTSPSNRWYLPFAACTNTVVVTKGALA